MLPSRRFVYLVAALLLCQLALPISAAMLPSQDVIVTLEVGVRDADGHLLADLSLSLLPPLVDLAEAQACTTDSLGRCTWQVTPGLYELHFPQPLDPISVLAVAESGLRSLGVTVGANPDTPTQVFLTLQPDGHLYFDLAPDAVIPQPFIPTAADLHLHGSMQVRPTVTPVGPASVETVTVAAEEEPATSLWRVILLIAIGLLCGAGLHLWNRYTRTQEPS